METLAESIATLINRIPWSIVLTVYAVLAVISFVTIIVTAIWAFRSIGAQNRKRRAAYRRKAAEMERRHGYR